MLILYGTVVASTVFIIIDMILCRSFILSDIPVIIKMYFIFGMYSLFTGLFVASNLSLLISSLVTYFAFSLVCFQCWYITHRTGSINWIFNSLTLIAILCSVYTILWGVDYYNGIYVTTMSAHNNPNTLGVVMIFGVFSLLINYEKFNKFLTINLSMVFAFLYVIVLCGSRKSLLACGGLVVFWFIIYLIDLKKQNNVLKFILTMVLLIIGIGITIYYIRNLYINTASYERLLNFISEGGSDTRKRLYQLAFEYWKKSPIIGIGFNQYRLGPFGTYSHSTYAEVLACTGLIGCLIFFIPLIKQTYKIVNQSLKKHKTNGYLVKMCLLMLIVEFFLGLGQIIIYSFTHMLMLFCITWLFHERNLLKSENKF